MFTTLIIKTEAWLLSLLLFVVMLFLAWLGNRLGNFWRKRKSKDTAKETETKGGFGSLEAGLFGLFGFILAITFGMSGNKYDSHRNILVEEANDIGTAILRSDLYPDSIRTEFRKDFKQYVEARISVFEVGTDTARYFDAKDTSAYYSSKIWKRATDMSVKPGMLIPSNQMIPALNAMIDITTTREANLRARIPDIIIALLFVLAITCTFVAGFGSEIIRRKDWIIIIGFALLTASVIYVTLDIGRPMRGLITSDIGQNAIVELREMFEQ
ncbi:MAG: hypothetical protein IPO83_00185 [Chitinophagaceae bacterium]|nr:hypothetical protein [Chitinophagaceae bacterium]